MTRDADDEITALVARLDQNPESADEALDLLRQIDRDEDVVSPDNNHSIEIEARLRWAQTNQPYYFESISRRARTDANNHSVSLTPMQDEHGTPFYKDIHDALDRKQAVNALELITEQPPPDNDAREYELQILRVRVRLLLQQRDEALAEIERLEELEDASDEPRSLVYRAHWYLQSAQHDLASECLERVMARGVSDELREKVNLIRLLLLFVKSNRQALERMWETYADDTSANRFLRLHIMLRVGWFEKVDRLIGALKLSLGGERAVTRTLLDQRKSLNAFETIRKAWSIFDEELWTGTDEEGRAQRALRFASNTSQEAIFTHLTELSELSETLDPITHRDELLFVLEMKLHILELLDESNAAHDEAMRIAELEPRHPEVLSKRLLHALGEGDTDAVEGILQAFEQTDGVDPRRVRYSQILRDLYFLEEHPEAHEARLEEWYAMLQAGSFAKEPMIFDLVEYMLIKHGREPLEDAFFEVEDVQLDPFAAAAKASHLLRSGDVSGAVEFANRWMDDDRGGREHAFKFALLFSQGGHHDEAVTMFQVWAEHTTTQPLPSVVTWAKSLILVERLDAARTLLNDHTVTAPPDGIWSQAHYQAIELLCDISQRQFRYLDVLELVDRLYNIDPTPRLDIDLACLAALFHTGRHDDARKQLDRVLDMARDDEWKSSSVWNKNNRRQCALFSFHLGKVREANELLFDLSWVLDVHDPADARTLATYCEFVLFDVSGLSEEQALVCRYEGEEVVFYVSDAGDAFAGDRCITPDMAMLLQDGAGALETATIEGHEYEIVEWKPRHVARLHQSMDLFKKKLGDRAPIQAISINDLNGQEFVDRVAKIDRHQQDNSATPPGNVEVLLLFLEHIQRDFAFPLQTAYHFEDRIWQWIDSTSRHRPRCYILSATSAILAELFDAWWVIDALESPVCITREAVFAIEAMAQSRRNGDLGQFELGYSLVRRIYASNIEVLPPDNGLPRNLFSTELNAAKKRDAILIDDSQFARGKFIHTRLVPLVSLGIATRTGRLDAPEESTLVANYLHGNLHAPFFSERVLREMLEMATLPIERWRACWNCYFWVFSQAGDASMAVAFSEAIVELWKHDLQLATQEPTNTGNKYTPDIRLLLGILSGRHPLLGHEWIAVPRLFEPDRQTFVREIFLTCLVRKVDLTEEQARSYYLERFVALFQNFVPRWQRSTSRRMLEEEFDTANVTLLTKTYTEFLQAILEEQFCRPIIGTRRRKQSSEVPLPRSR